MSENEGQSVKDVLHLIEQKEEEGKNGFEDEEELLKIPLSYGKLETPEVEDSQLVYLLFWYKDFQTMMSKEALKIPMTFLQ